LILILILFLIFLLLVLWSAPLKMPERLSSPVHWILFDAVGTLIYADPPVADVYHAAARRFGSRLTRQEIQKRFCDAVAAEEGGQTTSEAQEYDRWRCIVHGVIDDVDDAAGELFEGLWRHFEQPEHWRLYDDVGPTLAQLAERGYRLGIASNFDGRLRSVASGHPSLAHCTEIFLSSEIGYTKPDPRYFAGIERQLGARPEEILLVGDDEVTDVTGARDARWQAIRLDRNCAMTGQAVINTLRSLQELIFPADT
jgi:putative hydrolase of the HAD superfamily